MATGQVYTSKGTELLVERKKIRDRSRPAELSIMRWDCELFALTAVVEISWHDGPRKERELTIYDMGIATDAEVVRAGLALFDTKVDQLRAAEAVTATQAIHNETLSNDWNRGGGRPSAEIIRQEDPPY